MTVALVRVSPLALVAGPWVAPPDTIEAAGIRVHGAQVGYENDGLRLVTIVHAVDQPSEHHTLASQSYALSGNTLTVTRQWQPPTLAAVKAVLRNRLDEEATRRWVAGRGAQAAGIESAYSNGVTAINNAANFAGAVNAYQAVVWP